MPTTVMIVDDDEDDLYIFHSALTEIDHTIKCITVEAAEKALSLLKTEKNKPDFIFLDLNMPRVNGKQCLARIKQSEELQNIPVIIYSTSKSQADADETEKLGAATFITKPSRLKDLTRFLILVLKKDWKAINKLIGKMRM
jgi:CheY-like chemotaxis protein